MKKHSRPVMMLHRFRLLRGAVIVIFLVTVAAGCATSPVGDLLPSSKQADLEEAVAHDSFPTANQAGIASRMTLRQ
ncbi:MAG: hypothetical protein JW719_14565 [Pirellulales bacterium]|nr:hypothetical protein [Pirellulales bacterium]